LPKFWWLNYVTVGSRYPNRVGGLGIQTKLGSRYPNKKGNSSDTETPSPCLDTETPKICTVKKFVRYRYPNKGLGIRTDGRNQWKIPMSYVHCALHMFVVYFSSCFFLLFIGWKVFLAIFLFPQSSANEEPTLLVHCLY